MLLLRVGSPTSVVGPNECESTSALRPLQRNRSAFLQGICAFQFTARSSGALSWWHRVSTGTTSTAHMLSNRAILMDYKSGEWAVGLVSTLNCTAIIAGSKGASCQERSFCSRHVKGTALRSVCQPHHGRSQACSVLVQGLRPIEESVLQVR